MMIGFSIFGILITIVISIFLIMNFNLKGAEQAVKVNREIIQPLQNRELIPSSAIDEKAVFLIFTNGTLRTFSASMYHNLSEDAYISADNPNIINIKKPGITYDQFFKTLPFKLTKECLITGTGQTFCTKGSEKLKFFLNGVEDENLLDKVIKNGDKLLVTFGSSEADIQLQIQQIPNP